MAITRSGSRTDCLAGASAIWSVMPGAGNTTGTLSKQHKTEEDRQDAHASTRGAKPERAGRRETANTQTRCEASHGPLKSTGDLFDACSARGEGGDACNTCSIACSREKGHQLLLQPAALGIRDVQL